MYNSMPRDLVEVTCHYHSLSQCLFISEQDPFAIGRNIIALLCALHCALCIVQGPFARVEKREDQLEVFLKYAGLFGVPEVPLLS